MATISKSGMVLGTSYHLGQTLPVGSVITKYTLTPDSTVTIHHGYPAGINVTIYNGTDAATEEYLKAIGYGTSGPYTVTSFYIPTDKITNTSAFQSSDLIKVEGTYRGTGITGDPTYTVEIEYTAPTLTWSNASLSLSQSASSLQVTATMGGTATHSAGVSVTYYLYEGSTQIGTFSGTTLTFTSTAGSHTYKTVAKAGGLTADGKNTSITVVHRLVWSNATLSLSQSASSLQVTATMGGTATHTGGSSVTYYLYEGSTQIGTFSNGSLTFTSTAGSHTYKTVASAGGLTADGKSTAISVADRLVWSSATLSLAQSSSSLQVTATMGGTATHTGGSTVTYYLYEGSTQIGTFSNGSLTFTSTVGSHTYKTVASAGGLTADGTTASISVAQPATGTVGYYDGTAFVECEIYRYNGTSFDQVLPYYYDGTDWVECSQ